MTHRVEADTLRLDTESLGDPGEGFAYSIEIEHRAELTGKDEALALVAVAVTHFGQRLFRPVLTQRVSRERIMRHEPRRAPGSEQSPAGCKVLGLIRFADACVEPGANSPTSVASRVCSKSL